MQGNHGIQINMDNGKKLNYYKAGTWIGVAGNLAEALSHANAPDPVPHFEPISQDEYRNFVFDLRFEDGEWQQ